LQSSPQEATQLLLKWANGDREALGRLVPMIHQELHRLAHHYMERESPDHLLQTTALVNEAYLKLVDTINITWKDKAHFFGVSANIMRRILVDMARARDSRKAGGSTPVVSLDEAKEIGQEKEVDLSALDHALNVLEEHYPRKGKVVELRFFGGLNVEETAEVLQVSPETVMRDWKFAKFWLYRQLKKK
jgi:RNA polymerase sigma factor (TIGR02999 family)